MAGMAFPLRTMLWMLVDLVRTAINNQKERTMWETIKKLATPAMIVYALVITILYTANMVVGMPYAINTPTELDRLAETHPLTAEAARKEFPQDGSGRDLLFIGNPDVFGN